MIGFFKFFFSKNKLFGPNYVRPRNPYLWMPKYKKNDGFLKILLEQNNGFLRSNKIRPKWRSFQKTLQKRSRITLDDDDDDENDDGDDDENDRTPPPTTTTISASSLCMCAQNDGAAPSTMMISASSRLATHDKARQRLPTLANTSPTCWQSVGEVLASSITLANVLAKCWRGVFELANTSPTLRQHVGKVLASVGRRWRAFLWVAVL